MADITKLHSAPTAVYELCMGESELIRFFFVLPIMYVLIKNYTASSISIPILQEFGKASYNIFLIQMAFYGRGPAQVVYKHIGNGFLQFIICFVSCLIMGYVYYRLESPITKKVIKATCDCFVEKII